MTFHKTYLPRLTLPLALLAMVFVQPAFAKSKGPKATFVKGAVETGKSETGKFKRLKRSKRVKPGRYVKTGEDGRAELTFADGSVMRIGPNSMLHVAESGFNKKTKDVTVSAQLIGGKAWAKVSKLAGADAKFELKSENAVAGVRGTVFRVNIDKDDATVVKVYDGAVAVSNAPHFEKKEKESTPDAPASPIKATRKQIATPYTQISKDEWEQVVATMMEVRVGSDGKMAKASAFTPADDEAQDPTWVSWNLACDAGNCDAY